MAMSTDLVVLVAEPRRKSQSFIEGIQIRGGRNQVFVVTVEAVKELKDGSKIFEARRQSTRARAHTQDLRCSFGGAVL
jgi:hypothetical protein